MQARRQLWAPMEDTAASQHLATSRRCAFTSTGRSSFLRVWRHQPGRPQKHAQGVAGHCAHTSVVLPAL